MLGIMIVGMVVGFVARWAHPAVRRVGVMSAGGLGALGALGLFVAGCATRLFNDGQILAWFAAMIGSALLVAAWAALTGRGR